jgi:hypothetical protein
MYSCGNGTGLLRSLTAIPNATAVEKGFELYPSLTVMEYVLQKYQQLREWFTMFVKAELPEAGQGLGPWHC